MLLPVTETRGNTQDTRTLPVLPVPCPMDVRATTHVLMSSPCWGCFSWWDRAAGCYCCNSSLSPAGCQGAAAWSAATRWSEPASRWPAGKGTAWIPPPQCNKPLHVNPRGLTRHRSCLSIVWISHWCGCNDIKHQFRSIKTIKIYCQLLTSSIENSVLTLKNPSYPSQIWLEAVIHHSEC